MRGMRVSRAVARGIGVINVIFAFEHATVERFCALLRTGLSQRGKTARSCANRMHARAVFQPMRA